MTESVTVSTPSRVHLGLLNLSDYGSTVDGGLGLMIDMPRTIVCVRSKQQKKTNATPEFALEVARCLDALNLNYFEGEVELLSAPEAHIGLGSKTQLRLAIASALTILKNQTNTMTELPSTVGRGGTSGIGSWGFWQGGFLVDAGHGRRTKSILPSGAVQAPVLAPLVHRSDFPWCVVLAECAGLGPVSGQTELRLFNELTPLPYCEVTQSYALVYGEIVPALLRKELDTFGAAVVELRSIGFKSRELAAREPQVTAVLDFMASVGLYGATMTSWGPVCVSFAEDSDSARHAVDQLKRHEAVARAWMATPDNVGATVAVDEEDPRPVRDWFPQAEPSG